MALTESERRAQRERTAALHAALVPASGRRPRLSAPVAWRPLTEAELRFCWPALEALCLPGRGRPAGHDVLTRFEACLEAACAGVPWREVRVAGMRGDTLHRCFRRWSARGLWMRLLARLAAERGRWPALEYFVCRAYRLAWRVQGMRGIVLARRLGLRSALRAPMGCLPDPVLSARFHRRFILPGLRLLPAMPWRVARGFLRLSRRLLDLCRGRRRIRRDWAPA